MSDDLRWLDSPEIDDELRAALSDAASEGPDAKTRAAMAAALAPTFATPVDVSSGLSGTMVGGIVSVGLVGAIAAWVALSGPPAAEAPQPEPPAPIEEAMPAQPVDWTETETETETETLTETETETETETLTETDTDTETLTEAETEAESVTRDRAVRRRLRLRTARPSPSVETETETETDADADAETETETEADTEADSDGASRPPETLLLERARAALPGNPRAAIRFVQEHQRHYPRGVLREEREVIAIEAMVRSGRRDGAALRAERFMRRYPSSVHRRQIERLLE